MGRQMCACTLIWLAIREPNPNEHKSYTNKCEWSDMQIRVAIAGVHSTKQLVLII